MMPNALVLRCLKVLGMDACGLQRKRRPTILVGPSSISNVPPLRKTDAGAEDRIGGPHAGQLYVTAGGRYSWAFAIREAQGSFP